MCYVITDNSIFDVRKEKRHALAYINVRNDSKENIHIFSSKFKDYPTPNLRWCVDVELFLVAVSNVCRTRSRFMI